MPGSRKVRVYQDRKKSPNWYIEWRDSEGRRRTESCGPIRADAEKRAKQVRQQLSAARLAAAKPVASEFDQSSTKTAPSLVTNVLRLRARIDCGESEVPVEINVELTPLLLETLRGLMHTALDT
jgi:hypothetical protein